MLRSIFNQLKSEKYYVVLIVLIALLTAISGEFKIYPFENTTFRFGLGSIFFILALLIVNVSIVKVGFCTSIVVILFRSIIGLFTVDSTFSDLLFNNIPAGIFYIVLALCFQQFQVKKWVEQPLKLGLYGAIIEVIANLAEQLTSLLITHHEFISFKNIVILCAVALIRNFVVVGLYSSILVAEKNNKMQSLLSLHSDLYTETLYMKQTIENTEQLTHDCFQLYKRLRDESSQHASEALRISTELHDIKKNSTRIVAGLSNLIQFNEKSSYSLSQILFFVIETNRKYSQHLNKEIAFTVVGRSAFETIHYLPLLSICNNIVSNAVEAIELSGTIQIKLLETATAIELRIENDGPTIQPAHLQYLFEAGYTTKFDSLGNASTGIGLVHVQSLLKQLNGSMEVTSSDTTTFTITLMKQDL